MEEPISSPEDLESDFTSKESDNDESDIELDDDDDEEMVETIGTQLPVSASRASVSMSQGSQFSSSSSEDDSFSNKKKSLGEVRRRKKRKRGSTNNDKIVNNKSSLIEDALRICDKDKLSQLAVSEGGLLCDELRIKVWPRLLGINMLDNVTILTDEELSQHHEYNQVVLDVNRSLKRFPPGIDEAARPLLQDQLTRLIVRVLVAQPGLHYYQGYHDVAITFLLVVGETISFQIMEKLSTTHLRQFMTPSMENTMGLLQLMYPIIRKSSPSLHSHLVKSELGTIFALPWLITWFGHVLPNYSDVVRLYDFFLAGPPLMPVYLAAAIVLHREKEILETDPEMSALHGLLSSIPVNLPFESLLVSCQKLYEKFPPYSIEKEAANDIKRQHQERVRGREIVSRKPNVSYKQLFTKIVIYSAPVLIGVLVWRVIQS